MHLFADGQGRTAARASAAVNHRLLARYEVRISRLDDTFPNLFGFADERWYMFSCCNLLAKSLIDFLDGLEDADHDTAIDDGPCDTDEREIAEGDDEPSGRFAENLMPVVGRLGQQARPATLRRDANPADWQWAMFRSAPY